MRTRLLLKSRYSKKVEDSPLAAIPYTTIPKDLNIEPPGTLPRFQKKSTDSPFILVVGGAGYIGSHMLLVLLKAGYQPIVLDNLSRGNAKAVLGVPLIVADMADKEVLRQLFSQYTFQAVMHFAAFIEVQESTTFPLLYYQNNVAATLALLEVMLEKKVNQFIFSSSAAVYGEPRYHPIDEAHVLNPKNPYGRTKKMIEEVIADCAASHGLHYAILRYFNAAGADPKGRIGENHEPESHLIPRVLQTILGKREKITVNGTQFATLDGSPIRDYVHVMDICEAHLKALKALNENNALCCNLGTGHGYSVLQIIEMVKKVTGFPVLIERGEARLGDPAILIANNNYASQILKWQPTYDLSAIIQHAWGFLKKI